MKEARCRGDWSVLNSELAPPLLELEGQLKEVFRTVTKLRQKLTWGLYSPILPLAVWLMV
jgi:hypothetical protein